MSEDLTTKQPMPDIASLCERRSQPDPVDALLVEVRRMVATPLYKHQHDAEAARIIASTTPQIMLTALEQLVSEGIADRISRIKSDLAKIENCKPTEGP